MKRYIVVLMALTLLAVPLVAGADDQGWMPPEWTPTPPARPSIDLVQLMQLLVTKGVISDQEYAQLPSPSRLRRRSQRTPGLDMERSLSQSSPEQPLTLPRALTRREPAWGPRR